jgi:hypothetical protein
LSWPFSPIEISATAAAAAGSSSCPGRIVTRDFCTLIGSGPCEHHRGLIPLLRGRGASSPRASPIGQMIPEETALFGGTAPSLAPPVMFHVCDCRRRRAADQIMLGRRIRRFPRRSRAVTIVSISSHCFGWRMISIFPSDELCGGTRDVELRDDRLHVSCSIDLVLIQAKRSGELVQRRHLEDWSN